jgi:putative integral membrane protein (TIGR02587 family)
VVVIGFRDQDRPAIGSLVLEALDAVGIGIVVTLATLFVLGRIGPDMSLDVVTGRVALELLPVTLGVSIANHLLPKTGSRTTDDEGRDAGRRFSPTLLDLFAAAAGALLLSLNIAPTDEVRMIAGELGEVRLVVLVLFSLLVSYVVVFEASLGNQEGRRTTGGLLQGPLEETVASYVVALAVAAGAIWLVGAFPDDPSLGSVLAAGRLAV